MAQTRFSQSSQLLAVVQDACVAMASAREAILLMLVGAAVALLVGPCTYFYMSGHRPSLVHAYRKHAHAGSEQGQLLDAAATCPAGIEQCVDVNSNVSYMHTEVQDAERNNIKQIVFGGLDGLLTMVAVMVGGIGADLSTRHIFALGLSNLLADAFSMGFGEYVSASAERDFALKQQAEEYREVRERPEEEIREMVMTYKKRGLSEADALAVARVLSKYDDFWVKHMLWEEMGVETPEEMGSPAFKGLVVFLSFVGFGIIPLLGILFPLCLQRYYGPDWYRPEYSSIMALLISGLTLFLMGCAIAVYTSGESIITSGILMLFNGCAASGISFSLSQGLHALAPTPTALHGSPPSAQVAKAEQECISAATNEESTDSGAASDRIVSSRPDPWPFFRRRFLRGLCILWLATSVFAFVVRQLEFSSRMTYESLRVFGWGLFTCIATGFGVIPLLFVDCDKVSDIWLGVANTIAGGMMVAASAGMLREAHDVSGPWDWQILLGLLCGVVFIKGSQALLGDDEEGGMEALCGAVMEKRHFRRAVLVFTVMFCHSAAEGVAVGVAFDKHCEENFGLFVSLLLAVQNMPEGMAVALVLMPRGVDFPLATLIATLTSVPQPLMAVVAFRFVETCQSLLPVGLAFAAGAMLYVSVSDLISEAAPVLGYWRVLRITVISFVVMLLIQSTLEILAGT